MPSGTVMAAQPRTHSHNYVPALPHERQEGGTTVEAYCLKCRVKREMSNPTPITMKNGKPATEGKCPECGTKMFKIGKA
jgi:Domain of unknown function (DUF5679)